MYKEKRVNQKEKKYEVKKHEWGALINENEAKIQIREKNWLRVKLGENISEMRKKRKKFKRTSERKKSNEKKLKRSGKKNVEL